MSFLAAQKDKHLCQHWRTVGHMQCRIPGVVSPVCASAGIVVTLALVIPAFYKVEPLAGLLMLPYLAWATFALFLNSTLIKMNPQVCTIFWC